MSVVEPARNRTRAHHPVHRQAQRTRRTRATKHAGQRTKRGHGRVDGDAHGQATPITENDGATQVTCFAATPGFGQQKEIVCK